MIQFMGKCHLRHLITDIVELVLSFHRLDAAETKEIIEVAHSRIAG